MANRSTPALMKWFKDNGDDATILDYVSNEIGAENLIAVGEFLNPKFIEVKGCVLFSWVYAEDNFEDWWKELNGDRAAIELVLNHLHLWDMFSDADCNDPNIMIAVGSLLVSTWSAALKDQFPNICFEVELRDDPDEYGPTIYLSRVGTPADCP